MWGELIENTGYGWCAPPTVNYNTGYGSAVSVELIQYFSATIVQRVDVSEKPGATIHHPASTTPHHKP